MALNRYFFSVLLLVFFNEIVIATEIAAGNVSGLWSKNNSPYNINGNITVAANSNLVIQAGVEVVFKGEYSLTVVDNGFIKAIGSTGDSIKFRSISNNNTWLGVRFINNVSQTDSSMLKYCSFKNTNLFNQSGNNSKGGGLFIDSYDKLSVSNCLFTGLKASNGGAVYTNTSFYFCNNMIMNCVASGDGGAYYLSVGTNLIENNTFKNNSASNYGGAIYLAEDYYGRTMISKNQFISNKSFTGGAISAMNTIPVIENNYFGGNQVTGGGDGGAVSVIRTSETPGDLFIRGNLFYNNSSLDLGGAVFISSVTSKDENNYVINNLFTGNVAVDGAGIWCDGKILISNCTLTANKVVNNISRPGSAMYLVYNNTINNTIVWNNNLSNDKDIFVHNLHPTQIGYSNIENGNLNIHLASGVTFNGTYTNNIDADPKFVTSGANPFSIQADSPCKNAGTPDTTGLKLPSADLAGFARVQDGRVDIGAYEYGTVLDIGSSAQKKSPVIVKSYPNPFNNRTQINFVLGDRAMVNLSVYNAAGQQVKQLLSSVLSAGEHSIGFNVDNLNTGVYFVRLKTADFSTETKVVLTK